MKLFFLCDYFSNGTTLGGSKMISRSRDNKGTTQRRVLPHKFRGSSILSYFIDFKTKS